MPQASDNPPARLALADGSVFHGTAFGDLTPRCVEGEACFNTSLSGYQEVLTDPSYASQIVTMTYPLIGNYGVVDEDDESRGVQPAGFVVRELARLHSNVRATATLGDWLARAGVPGIAGIDTRALTRKLRVEGAMDAVLCTDPALGDDELVDRARAAPGMVGRNLVKDVSVDAPLNWGIDTATDAADHGSDSGSGGGLDKWQLIQGEAGPRRPEPFNVVALDCGAKHNIYRNLAQSGCALTVLPWDTPAEAILERKPDGLFISNGPGDPAAVTATIDTLKRVTASGSLPTFGICLGHQLLGLSLGAQTFKLKFGHRGANQPVQNLGTRKVEITSQNHGFAVDPASLERAGGTPTHINLNDDTLEGFRHTDLPIFAVQYHPEAAPGPHDARYLFDCFIDMMTTGRAPSAEQMDAAQRARNNVTATLNGRDKCATTHNAN